jgi:hypothetical protein
LLLIIFPTVPPPVPPVDFTGLSEEELQWMEGVTRENVEARLRCLHNIQLLLDASVTLMLQYSAAAASRYTETLAASGNFSRVSFDLILIQLCFTLYSIFPCWHIS